MARRLGRPFWGASFTVLALAATSFTGVAPASAAAACPFPSVPVSGPVPGICQVTFNSDATWLVPDRVTSVDVIVVGAGGGGNGASSGTAGGGGGGGQVVYDDDTTVIPGASIVVKAAVGALGGGFGGALAPSPGTASRFGNIIAAGGAAGGATANDGNASGTPKTGGAGAGTSKAGGGGGGAGAVGISAPSATAGGAGGAGVAPSFGLFTGETTRYGGGGGGGSTSGYGALGTDGGGQGGDGDYGNAAPGSLGGGGGGGGTGIMAGNVGVGGMGGAGIVIVRFRQPPAAPTSLVATPSAGAVSIAFTPGQDGSSTISNYQYSLGSGPWTTISPDDSVSPVAISGLTDDSAYSISLRAVNAVGTGTASSPVSVTPGVVPAAPTDLSATAGDASARISFTPGAAGTRAIDNYAYSLDAGTTWVVFSPAVTASPVSISSLTNGTAYSIQLRAVSAIGPGAASSAVSVTPAAPPAPRPPRPIPTPIPAPVPPLTPGDAYMTVNGLPQEVNVAPNPQADGVDLSGAGFTMALQGLDGEGIPRPLGPGGVLTVDSGGDVRTSGTGYRSATQIDVYLDPPSLVNTVGARSVTGTLVGSTMSDLAGGFATAAKLPADVPVGDHVLQVVGLASSGSMRAVSIAVRVAPDASIALVAGPRMREGKLDRIAATGTTIELPAGAVLTPYVRLGEGQFVKGKASFAIRADGSFRWSRLVKPGRAVTAYVAWTDVTSDEVTWMRLS